MSRATARGAAQTETVTVRIELQVDPAQISPDERRSIAVSAYTALHQRFSRRPWFLGIGFGQEEGR